ncbi:hypothetical protein MHK_007306 [Candidatus Magnetomorum sp. HK-1]|nr:hypothetical protein MHK_007306 [Candidatus Magnetomorum sp. HK-1]
MPISVTQVSNLFILLFFKIQLHFEFIPDWYKQPQVSKLVSEYYCLLFLICKENPKLSKNIVRCKFCQIYFITNFCNAGRKDLGCPFGCQEANRKEKSNIRSSKYHRDHKDKKKKLNENRYRLSSKKNRKKDKINPTFRYLHIIISYIERRIVAFEEILSLIIKSIRFIKKQRQHT